MSLDLESVYCITKLIISSGAMTCFRFVSICVLYVNIKCIFQFSERIIDSEEQNIAFVWIL